MLKDRHIAFFIDVDNVGLKSDNYFNVIEQLNGMGTILSGKIYGAGERKHKDIFADAQLHGYKVERPMRIKRRGRKEFDSRIFVDVVDAVTRTPAIDAVCIVAQPTDLVYLYSYLRSRGIKVIALDNADDASCSFVDEVVDLGVVFELKLSDIDAFGSLNIADMPAATVEQPVEEAQEDAEQGISSERTDELLKEIDRLKTAVSDEQTDSAEDVEQAAEPETTVPVEETSSSDADGNMASIVDEAKSLLERIAEMREEQNSRERPASQETPQQEQPQAQTAAPDVSGQPTEPARRDETPVSQQSGSRAAYASSNDGDLIKRIEEIRRNSRDGDDEFVEEIRKLLDGLE